jgi:hypothetical protein
MFTAFTEQMEIFQKEKAEILKLAEINKAI